MSHLVNLSDDVYERLSKLKNMKNASYSEIVHELLQRMGEINKTLTWDDLILNAKERDLKFKGKKEKINHDLIAYGASRDGS